MSLSLFVGNIPYGAMEKELRHHFSSCGDVQSIRFIMDHRRGRFRGFAFVTMEEEEAARAAIGELHDKAFQGRKLIVSEAQPTEETAKHPG